MFLATMLAKSQPYSTREEGERALACFIQKRHLNLMVQSPPLMKLFTVKCEREEWGKALKIWNFHVNTFFTINHAYYMAQVSKSDTNVAFT